MDEELELEPILTQLSVYPPLDRMPSDETEARLPLILGGLSLALAQVLKIIDPDLKIRGQSTGNARSARSTSCCSRHHFERHIDPHRGLQ
jgi:hypothetical protein